MRLEEIECEVKNIIEKLEERERDLIDEDGESSMLCELNVMNLISFLKHFKVEINYSQFNNHNQSNNNNNFDNIGDNNFDNILKQKVYYLLFIYFLFVWFDLNNIWIGRRNRKIKIKNNKSWKKTKNRIECNLFYVYVYIYYY